MAQPAFFLGVTGKLKFGGYGDAVREPEGLSPVETELRRRVWAVLDWLRYAPPAGAPSGALDPATGVFDPTRECASHAGQCELAPGWRSVGLEKTPIVVLSSLAPGIDTLVAEAALDYAEGKAEGRSKGKKANVTVRAPLPFPLDIYARSSTFQPENDRDSWAAKAARREHLLHRLKNQEGFVETRDLFCVELDKDLEGDHAADLVANSPEGKPRRRLRYRAAGEYIATHCQLLLAVYDETAAPDGALHDPFAPGTAQIVEAKRRGLSYELLALANNFAWADSGPVLRIPIAQSSDGRELCSRPLALLYPYDTQPRQPAPGSFPRRALEALALWTPPAPPVVEPDEAPPDDDPDWQRSGDELLRGAVYNQEQFNGLAPGAREGESWKALLRSHKNDAHLEIPLNDEALGHAAGLADLAAVRRRASSSAMRMESLRRSLLSWLAWLILVAAAALGAFEHWTPPATMQVSAKPGLFVTDPTSRKQVALLFLSLGCLAASGVLYHRYLLKEAEQKRFDHRAIGEGLRVQFYWSLAGIQAAASAEYLQRLRSELSWIRCVISAMTIPVERWRASFPERTHATRVQLLHAVRVAWVRGQMHYARIEAGKNEARGHRWHHWGWTLAAAGLLNLIGQLLTEAFPSLWHAVENRTPLLAGWVAGLGGVLLLLVLVRAFLPRGARPHAAPHDALPSRSFVVWLLSRALLWGWALVLGAAAFLLPSLLTPLTPPWPDVHGWWIICTGFPLLFGAMCLAWSERNFHGEHARQFRALEDLHACADRRLEGLIRRYADLDPTGAESARTLEEIQSLLFELGGEALAENAEWLILHRIRPLEPFLAG